MSAPPDPPAPLDVVPASPTIPVAFFYSAQTEHGICLSGSIEAPDHATAIRVLENMRLRITEVRSDETPKPPAASADGFTAFNQRLAQLSKSGLPVEEGLRLIAADMRRGRFARVVSTIAGDLKNGVPLDVAFEKHRRHFPTFYGRLIDAGAAGGNLPGVLLNLGRHLDVQKRRRAALWRSLAYPLGTFCGLLLVVGFIGLVVMPRFEEMFVGFHQDIPVMMQAVMWFGRLTTFLAAIIAVTIATFAVARILIRAFGAEAVVTERVLTELPLIGPVLRSSLIARWLDIVRIGILAGLHLPAAIALAGECMRSSMLRRDGSQMTVALLAGTSLSTVRGALLPATVPTTIEFAMKQDIATVFQTLCDLYERQAELRLDRIRAILTPVLTILITVIMAFVISGIVLPLASLIQNVMGLTGW